MIQRELLGTARVPGGTELKLYRHDRDFMIVMGHNELMSSRMSGSEIALATETIKRLKGRPAPSLLIGGYGMGFTLRAALEVLGPKAELVVAELVPAAS
jgi:spermidine synthase